MTARFDPDPEIDRQAQQIHAHHALPDTPEGRAHAVRLAKYLCHLMERSLEIINDPENRVLSPEEQEALLAAGLTNRELVNAIARIPGITRHPLVRELGNRFNQQADALMAWQGFAGRIAIEAEKRQAEAMATPYAYEGLTRPLRHAIRYMRWRESLCEFDVTLRKLARGLCYTEDGARHTIDELRRRGFVTIMRKGGMPIFKLTEAGHAVAIDLPPIDTEEQLETEAVVRRHSLDQREDET